ncbi:TldD/PmbA family protein [Vibrio harveyi]|uniref:TldD/PmbA family protein n=1 Tax=Vibrio harveyi TaxID=669 RepID=UPI001EFC653E|nr:TldD/PmbA family protein [Vibrio harveyi]MCG9232931.1 TldD/PmbA family protein [Vibrio harveyi]MCG9588704.1 TldD/PmbA family protein [Vibrio harveyi]CAH1230466.1 TldE/PmbA protein, part of proposed TldE/TldD proteolytic complex (PMID 12029038) [Vibrio harveyi]CAH1579176.1 TldE/PmbA protein, part of proposed TldE/TldD proteolytic complex (PMID 12029038) [Vibrio harveyi]
MSQEQQLLNAVDYVLSEAKRQGAEADVIVNRNSSFSLKANQGKLDEYKVSSSQVLGVRVVKDARVATSYSESLEQPSLDLMLTNALQSARFSKQDEHQTISCVNSQIATDVAEISQEDTTSVDEKIELSLALEQGVVALPHASSAPYNGYSDGETQLIIANTQGTLCQHFERSFTCYAYTLFEKDGKQSMAGRMSLGRRFDELNPAYYIEGGYNLARDLLEGAPVATGNYPAIFHINALASLFGAFGSAFSGVSAMKGITPLGDKLGQRVASDLITFIDTAYMPNGMAIASFDSEGFATQDNVMIANGELKTLLHNSQTASYLGAVSTASAARGAKSSLEVSANHKVIATGNSSASEVKAGEYLELVELQGVHSGADAVSGDFSFGASGFLCRDGERIQPVRGITVAGNFYKMLQEVEAVGDAQLINDSRTFFSPDVRFARLSIGGK